MSMNALLFLVGWLAHRSETTEAQNIIRPRRSRNAAAYGRQTFP